MVISKRSLVGFAGACLVGLCTWAVVCAQQQTSTASRPVAAPTRVRGASERGVTMALKDAVDRIPTPAGNAAKYFRVVSIAGEKTAKTQIVSVELEVQDQPFLAQVTQPR